MKYILSLFLGIGFCLVLTLFDPMSFAAIVNIPNGVYVSGSAYGNSLDGFGRAGDGNPAGNTLNINSGNAVTGNAYGGWGLGGAVASENTVFVRGAATIGTTASSTGNVYGGWSESGFANENIVNIANATARGIVFGAWVDGGNSNQLLGNSVFIGGGAVLRGNLYGAYSQGNNGILFGNSVVISGGSITASGAIVAGAYGGIGMNTVSDNSVALESGTINNASIYGGRGQAGSSITGNWVDVSGGTIGNGAVFGGQSINGAGPIGGNAILITGGNVTAAVYGGSSGGGGAVVNNAVTITGGSVKGAIYGGYSARGTATGNEITIAGTAVLQDSDLSGGRVGSGAGDAFTGNTLNKDNTAAVHGAANFQFVNFGYSGEANIAALDTTPTGSAQTGVTLDTGLNIIDFGGVIAGTGSLTKTGMGTLTLTGASTYSGDTNILAGALQAGTANALSPNSAMNVGSAGTLSLNGFSQAVAGLTNAGLISMGVNTAPGAVLTVNGNYVGLGGTILLNTHLGADGSPSDKLVINGGTATGSTFLRISNAGGLGALTVGSGIPVVETANGGSTALGAFTLSGQVTAGAYDYLLYRGSVDQTSPDDWYLRSAYSPPSIPEFVIPPGPSTPEVVIVPADPSDPVDEILQIENIAEADPGAVIVPVATRSLPDYRMEVPVYMAAPALMERMGRTMLGTYHDRVSEDRLASGAGQDKAGWLRVFGEFGHVGFGKSASSFANQGPSYDFGIDGVQIGFDALRLHSENGLRHVAGLYGGYMHGHADVNQAYNSSKAGTVDMDGYSLGGYYTLTGQPGWYVDAVLQATWYAGGEARSEQGNKIHPNGFGLAGSLEGGYPIRLGQGWAIEPQAQIIWQRDQLANDSDQYGRVKYQNITAWTGRVGARVTKDWRTQSGKKGTVWARVNVWHQMGDDAKTTFTNINGQYPTGLKTSLGGTWGQAGLGVSGQLTKRLSAFAAGDYNLGLGNNNGQSFSGRIGLKYEF